MTETNSRTRNTSSEKSQFPDGKIAWITGAGSGMGQAAAVALAQAGMTVVLSGRRRQALEETADLVRAVGGNPVIEELDVADSLMTEKVVARIEEHFGRLDVAVLSAGINVKKRAWENVEVDGWDDIINIDLNGAFYSCRAVLPMMRKQKSGLIINVASRAGVRVSKMTGPAYNAAKHGMVAMSESINLEEGVHGIRCCALCPGEVATPILDNRPVPVTEEQKSLMIQVEDISDAIMFLVKLPPRVCVNQLVMSPTVIRPGSG